MDKEQHRLTWQDFIKCDLCAKEPGIFILKSGQKICNNCRINKFPLMQFCDYCSHEIRTTIVDDSSDLFAVEITQFSPKFHLGKHIESLKWCHDCYLRVQYAKVNLE